MAYIEGGTLKPNRSIWRLSIFTETFWAIVFYLKMFWMTMFSKDASTAYRRPKSNRGSGGSGGWGGGGAPPGNPGTGGTGNDPRRFSGMSRVRGIDHTATCGSCCG